MSDNLYIVEYLRAVIYFLQEEGTKSHLIDSLERAITLVREQFGPISNVSFFGFNAKGQIKQKVAAEYVRFAIETLPRDFVFNKDVADIYGMTIDNLVVAWKQGLRRPEDFAPTAVPEVAKVYLTFYPEVTVPIARSEIQTLERELWNVFSPDHFILAGEYRRGKQECARVVILVLQEKAHELLTRLYESGYLYHGSLPWVGDKYVDIVKILHSGRAHRFEVYAVDAATIVPTILARTDDNAFDLYLRKHLENTGYSLSKTGLIGKRDKQRVRLTNEAMVFEAAGLQYLSPEQRNLSDHVQRFF